MVRVVAVVGSRREAVTLAPVIDRLDDDAARCEAMVVLADDPAGPLPVLELLGLVPDLALDHASARADRAERTARILTGLARALTKLRPDLLLTTGEGPAGVAAHVAAAELDLPVVTVTGAWPGSGGGRSADAFHRRVAMIASRRIAVPDGATERAWIRAGADPGRLAVTGSPVVDTVARIRRTSPDGIRPLADGARAVVLALSHLGGSTLRDAVVRTVTDLTDRHPEVEVVCPLPRLVDDAVSLRRALDGIERIRVSPALDYEIFLDLLAHAALVITDAEGTLEEAAALGIPTLVTTPATARRSIIETGAARVVGADAGRIVAEASLILRDADHARSMRDAWTPYGVEDASDRVAAEVLRCAEPSGSRGELVPVRRAA